MIDKKKALDIREIFSQNLKFYRIKANISQEKLGEMVELSDKYISDLERQLYDPSLKTIDSLAKALNIEPYELLKPDHMEDVIKSKRVDERK